MSKNQTKKAAVKQSKGRKTPRIPLEDLESELRRVRRKGSYFSTMRATIFVLIVVAAATILVATLWLPVLKIYGNSMTPTLEESDIVFSIKSKQFETGDIIAFYSGNKLLVKRCIAGPTDVVDIDENGTVSVNGQVLDEPYVSEMAKGDCNIELPYQVPADRYFVLGDHRSTSSDSRSSTIGCILKEDIVGRIVFRIWPFDHMGKIE